MVSPQPVIRVSALSATNENMLVTPVEKLQLTTSKAIRPTVEVLELTADGTSTPLTPDVSDDATASFFSSNGETLLPCNTRCSTGPATQEWIPPWLRKNRLIPFAACCVIFAASLEALRIEVSRQHGLTADHTHQNTVRAVRYTPTICIVVLSLVWKGVASDSKKITPWSDMSLKWSKGSRSIFLDYITASEALSIFSAARHRHWAVLVGLAVGFLWGALVAMANSLTFVDFSVSSSKPAAFHKTTVLNFTGTLENADNHSLPIPYSYLGQQPYAAVAAQAMPNGRTASWTKDGYVFESFTNVSASPESATFHATVQAFHPAFNCHPVVNITGKNNDENARFTAGVGSQPELNCSAELQQTLEYFPRFSAPQVFGWLNVTSCDSADTDLRLISTFALARRPPRSGTQYDPTSFTPISVMCSPAFTIQDAEVSVNRSTDEIFDYRLFSSTARAIDIQTSLSAIYIYLSNPVDGRVQGAYTNRVHSGIQRGTGSAILPDTEVDYFDVEPIATLRNVTAAATWLAKEYHLDPFSNLLTGNQAIFRVNSYLRDPGLYSTAVSQLSTTIMAEVVSFLARRTPAEPQNIGGTIWTDEPRLFLRMTSLRVLQIALLLIAGACVLQMTIIRPRTSLQEDPGCIALTALVVAASSEHLENTFAESALSSEESMQYFLAWLLWRLQTGVHDSTTLNTKARNRSVSFNCPQDSQHTGFHPLALRLWARWGVLLAMMATMIALATLMQYSLIHHGLCGNTRIASYGFASVPTIVLLVLGYACSGIDGSVRTMGPYWSLWKGSSSKRQPLLFILQDTPSIWVPIRAIRKGLGLSVLLTSFAVLLIPVIKIVAAGLYRVQLNNATTNVRALMDTSIVDSLEHVFNNSKGLTFDTEAAVVTASEFTEWAMIPKFNIPVQLGILSNLVFSNLTDIDDLQIEGADLSTAEVSLNVPAISVDVSCTPASMIPMLRGYAPCRKTGDMTWDFEFYCDAACKQILHPGRSPLRIPEGNSRSTCYKPSNRFIGSTNIDLHHDYKVLLADFSPIQHWVGNRTALPPDWLLGPDIFNVSLPTIRAASCHTTLTRITVNATFARKSPAHWSPISFDASTIARGQPYPNPPLWMTPPASESAFARGGSADASPDRPGALDSPTLRPTRGASSSFFELLASYAEYELGSLSAVLDEGAFVRATQGVLAAYATNMLTQLRPFARNASGAVASKAVGTAAVRRARVVQDWTSTVATEVLLGVMVACFLVVAVRAPGGAVLPRNPGSIAAKASLLARSELVGRLRREGVGRVGESRVWEEEAALGWWRVRRAGDVEGKGGGEDGAVGLRWGIDVGEPVSKSGWDCPPGEVGA